VRQPTTSRLDPAQGTPAALKALHRRLDVNGLLLRARRLKGDDPAHFSHAEAYSSMLKLSVEIELEGYDGSKMAAAAALRVAFLSSAVGGAIRGWTINEITLVDEGNAAFDELRAEVESAGDVDDDGFAEEVNAEVASRMAAHQAAKDAHRHGYGYGYGYDDPEARVI
jgi:hypothetical protein